VESSDGHDPITLGQASRLVFGLVAAHVEACQVIRCSSARRLRIEGPIRHASRGPSSRLH
jgi:hypothetical protein